MRRVLLSAGIGLSLLASLASPAAAQRDPIAERPSAGEATTRPVDRPGDRADESLRLSCVGRTNDDGRAGVVCTWSATTQPQAAGYRLVRTNGTTRTVVFRTRDLAETTTVDGDVRLGVTYGYSIQVLDDRGSIIGTGGPVRAGVDAPEPELEVLRLRCEAVPTVVAARCTWRPATSATAVGYQLWRLVDRGERELVWRGGLDQTSATDDLPDDTRIVRYAVLAVGAEGELIGQSRPVTLRFVDGPAVRPHDRISTRALTWRVNTYR